MPMFPLPVEQFGGLNLEDAPDELGFSGAIDLLNVDLDLPGRVRSRWGITKLNSVAATSSLLGAIGVLPGNSAGTTYIVSGLAAGGPLVAYNASGTLVATGGAGNSPFQYAALGTGTTGPFLYIAWSGGTIMRFDGATFTAPAGMPSARALAVSGTNTRLVASDSTNLSRVKFSDAGAPETWTTNNFVDLHPNDGQQVRALVTWGQFTFALKDYKFFVFYGEDTDATGQPIFNYRTVDTGQGVGPSSGSQIPACSAPDGVYFANRQGIWRTIGGPPQKVSMAIDPLFRDEAPASFTALGGNFPSVTGLTYASGKIFASLAAGSMLVYTIATGIWTVWSRRPNGMAMMKVGNTERLVITEGGSNFLYFSPSATDDNGAAITSYYQSGFDNIAPPRRFAAHYLFGNTRKRIRKWKVTGSGTVSFSIAHDFGSPGTASSLALATSPAIGSKWHNVATRGRLISYKLSSTSPFSVQSLTAYLAGSEPPLLGNPADK